MVGSQKLGAKRAYRCKSSSYQVAYEFYATNAPNPPNWTLNSCCLCFVLFGSIWDCLVALLGAKRAKLVPKFWPRSRVRIFHNERNRSTPLDPKLMFWSVFYYLGAFGTVWLPYKTRCKRDRTGAKVHATKSHRNFSQQTQLICPHWTLNSCFCAFCTIWVHLGPFGWITKTRCKTGLQVQKFELPSRV